MKIHPCLHAIPLPTSLNPIAGVDAIYLINLDRRPEKLRWSLSQWDAYHLRPTRVSAVDGWQLSDEAVDQLCTDYNPSNPKDSSFMMSRSKNTCFHSSLTKGGLGCALSHLSIYASALQAGFETIWVLEDDATLEKDPRLLSAKIDDLDQLVGKEGWDLFYTDDDHCFESQEKRFLVRPDMPARDPHLIREQVGSDWVRISARCQTHSMILRRSGMQKILSFLTERGLFRPIDVEISFIPTIQLYNLCSGPVHGRNRPSYSDTSA